MSGKALLPGFADDDEDQEDQIKQSEADITTLFREGGGSQSGIELTPKPPPLKSTQAWLAVGLELNSVR